MFNKHSTCCVCAIGKLGILNDASRCDEMGKSVSKHLGEVEVALTPTEYMKTTPLCFLDECKNQSH